MAKLKYHGLIPVLFQDLSRGPVKPEEEFDVPDSEKERYTRRTDIEDLEPLKPVEAAAPEPAASDTEEPPAPASTETATDTAPEAAPPTE